MGKSDQFGRSEAGWPNQHQAGSRMAESTSGGRPEAGWPNQHQAADPKPNSQINIRRSPKPIDRLRLKANGRISIRRPIRSRTAELRPRLNGREQTAESRRPKSNGRINIRRSPKPDGRINIRQSSKPDGRINIRRSPKPSDQPDNEPRPNPGRG